MPIQLRLSYYPWITQHIQPAELDRHIHRFASALERALGKATPEGVTVQVLPPLDVPKQVAQIADGGADLALMNPLGFVFARQRSKVVEAVAVAQRVIDGTVGTTYYAQLYTHRRTAIRKLVQAKGRSVGFGARFSTSNFLVPALELRRQGLHPLVAFSSATFFGGHDTVAKAVYDGKVDLGAGHDGAIADLASQYGYGDAGDCLVQLHRSPPIPSDPIALRSSDAKQMALVTQGLLDAAADPEGKESLGRFWGGVVGLAKTTASEYRILEGAVAELGLTADDLLI
jgi:phosphate/phosphite/phosphonate ABC transporter binding protein